MATMFRKIAALVLVLPFVFVTTAFAQEDDELEGQLPDAQIYLSGKSFGLILTAGSGGGRLVYKGDQYAFQMGGAKFGIAGGISKAKASGDVYNLKRLEDFPGKYEGTTAGMTAVVGGGGSWYKNEKGVMINLKSESAGAAVDVSAGSFNVEVSESTLARMKEVDAASGN